MKRYLFSGLFITSLLFPYISFAYELTDKDRSIVASATSRIEKIITSRGELMREKIIVLLKRAANNSSSNPRLQRIMEMTVQNLRTRDADIENLFGYNEGIASTGTGVAGDKSTTLPTNTQAVPVSGTQIMKTDTSTQSNSQNIPFQANSQSPIVYSNTGVIRDTNTNVPTNTQTVPASGTKVIKSCYIQN